MILTIRTAAHCALAAAMLAGCGGASPPQDRPAAAPLGAWISTGGPGPPDHACPWIIELFADGSLETNHLTDDGDAACAFERLPFELDEQPGRVVLRAGGPLSHCLLDWGGGHLRLACDDHLLPDGETAQWRELAPLPVEPLTSLDAIAGTYLAAVFMGTPLILTITPDGRLEPNVEDGDAAGGMGPATLEIVERDRLLLAADDRRERCLFRATRERLALRCQPAADGWPRTLWERDSDLETMVLYRLPAPSPAR